MTEGFQVAVRIVFFHLEHHKECIYDRLIFMEGGAEGEELDTLCGQMEDTHVVTRKSNTMSIR